MKRKVYQQLLEWKDNNPTQSLLVKGARQVGKTYIIKQFGKREFKHMLYLNFEDQLDMRQAFDDMPNPDAAVKTLQAYGIANNIFNIEGQDTLIVFDEIQLSKRAYSLLKPLTEMNKYRIIASGSLLGINLSGNYLDPGPAIQHIDMHPMDFEEFLWAIHGETMIDVIVETKAKLLNGVCINQALHDLFNKTIKDYMLIGGMPQVVLAYLNTKDLGKVYLIQQSILNLYRSDIQQYQSTQDYKMKTLQCFDSIHNQFAKDNHRFMYQTVEKNKTARHYGLAIDWLERTGITKKCYHVNHLRGVLIDGKSNLFKVYMNDIGLLVCMLGQGYIYRILNDELNLFKGALYEQLLAQMLIAKNLPLYYIRMGDHEIDFLVEHQGQILPIECKSGGNTKSKSLKSYIAKHKPTKAFKISMNNINNSDDIMKAIPHYAFSLLSIKELVSL